MDPTNPHHLFIEAMKHVLSYALESSRDVIMNFLAVADWVVIRFTLAALFSAFTPIMFTYVKIAHPIWSTRHSVTLIAVLSIGNAQSFLLVTVVGLGYSPCDLYAESILATVI